MDKPNSHFAALRTKAREQRDKALAHIRAEYQTNLLQIAELEQRLLGKIDPRRVKTSAAIERVIPRDEAFTVADVMAALESLDAGRVWPKASVHRHITKLREIGLVRRVKRAKVNEPAVYARTDGPVKVEAEDRNLRQVILETVTRPMRIAEVVAAVLEAGHKTNMVPAHLRTHILRVLRQTGFRERGGKWAKN